MMDRGDGKTLGTFLKESKGIKGQGDGERGRQGGRRIKIWKILG